jgi:uncharacterized protein YbjT (DUF2867 family)
VRGDLVTGAGIEQAVDGVDVIAHCATGAADGGVRGLTYRYSRATDVEPTRRMLDLARSKGSPHVVYISIVGVDAIPLGYYRAKLETEAVIASSGLPSSILRTTQWHTLAWEFCERFTRLPVVLVPKGVRSQLLDASEVSERMAKLVTSRTSGRVPDMGGPHVLEFADIVRAYLRATGKKRAVASVRFPGKTMRAFAGGHNLAPEHPDGKITWGDWLAANASR